MCGIAGFIGESKDPEATFELITKLFEKTESRGEDAAGFWGAESENKVIYHKEPIKATELVKKPIWKKVKKLNPNLLLVHARNASFGMGLPSKNCNNHPFVTADKSVGIIHNGKVSDSEYSALKKKYTVSSACDSEMFLRVFEQERFNGFSIEGVKKIWSYMSKSQMAVAIGEMTPKENTRRLWLFRNKHRTLWLTDLRETLGQVFFFSTPDIWDEACWSCENMYPYLGKIKLFALPTEEVWSLKTNASSPVVIDEYLEKYDVSIGESKPWKPDPEKLPINKSEDVFEIITKLDDNEEVIKDEPKPVKFTKPVKPLRLTESKNEDDLMLDNAGWPLGRIEAERDLFPDMSDSKQSITNLNDFCDDIRKIIGDVETSAENSMIEHSMSANEYSDLISSLEQTALDLSGILRIVNS